MKIISALFLTLLCCSCGYSSPHQVTQGGIVPVISDMAPDNVNAGAGSFTLTVNGKNFNNNAVVNWNGVMQPTRFVTANQLTVMIPASAVAAPGMVAVTVTNPGSSTAGGPYGGVTTASETSSSVTFTIN